VITAELKDLHSPDVFDLATYSPESSDHFGFLLQIMAGPSGSEGEESFDVVVCTPSWLTAIVEPDDVLIGRHHLILRRYDFVRLHRFIAAYCAQCTGESWQEVAEKLGRLGKWEFEDYRPWGGDTPPATSD
jgi:hypothetical protein